MTDTTSMTVEQKRVMLRELLRRKKRADLDEHPLSHGQRSLWFMHKLAPESSVYNVAFAWQSTGGLDLDVLKNSFQALINRHSTLRTTYKVVGDNAVQIVHENSELSFEIVDSSPDSAESFHARIMAAASAPFDLENGPVIRVHVFSQGAGKYVQLVTTHHIAIDFWSMEQLIEELRELFVATGDPKQANLPSLNCDYTDFVKWQLKMLDSESGKEHWEYWRHRLHGEISPLDLPLDHPRPRNQTYDGNAVNFEIDSMLASAARKFAASEGATLYVIFLSVFMMMLYRYTRQDDFLVGAPTVGRPKREFEGLVGYFVNPVVFRASFTGEMSFRQLVSGTRRTVVDALDHQDFPFPLLVERLKVDRDSSRSPLTDVFFVWDRTRGGRDQFKVEKSDDGSSQFRQEWGQVELESFKLTQVGAASDLVCLIVDHDDSISGSLTYNTDLFDESTIKRFTGEFQRLFSAALSNPDELVSRLPLMSEPAAAAVIEKSAPKAADFVAPDELPLQIVFENIADRYPDRTALTFNGISTSYSQLNQLANQLANHLKAVGVECGSLVGLSVERSPDVIIGILGILKAGGAYLPLDPAHPAERRQFMVSDAEVNVVVTSADLRREYPTCTVIRIDSDDAVNNSGNNLEPVQEPEDLAYVIYTSGSTGKPKGVKVTHHCVSRLFKSTEAWFRFDREDVWTLFHSYSFDFSVWEIWGALLHGARLVVVPQEVSQSPSDFYDLLVSENVTVLNQTPSAFRQLDWVEQRRNSTDDLSLRWVIFGGEKLDYAMLKGWFQRHGAVRPRLVNMYGITETTVHVTYREIEAEQAISGMPSLIGEPIPDMSIRVLDSALRPCPVGVPGELYVGGAGVCGGYLNRDEMTRERFIESPYPADKGCFLYRTGDLGRRLVDDDIEYLGRIDSQVQIRGFRIELGEVQSVLESLPEIAQAVVIVREKSADDRTLVAYVVAGGDGVLKQDSVRAHIERKLPAYMRPSALIELPSVPLTANGKVDYAALPAPDDERLVGEKFVAPGTATEQKVAAIWCEILDLTRVGVDSNFFDLGGHSLLATRVVTHINEAFHVEFPLVAFFETPTIAAIARQLEEFQCIADGLDAEIAQDSNAEREEFEL